MYSLFREILAYVCFLWMLLLVVYGQRDPNAFHLNRAISRSLGSPGEEVLSHRAMYHWANSSLLSGLFGQNPGFLADGASFLVGGVRLRQVRISNHSCKPPSSLVSEVPNCRAPYSWEKEDRRDYVGDGWLLPVSDNDTAALRDHSTEALTVDGESKLVGITTDGSWKNTAWQYRGSSKLRSYPVWGRFALYRGGGYALDLGTDKATAQRTLNYLQRTNWLDTQTRALFVEFTIYNANVNLFCVATLILENSGLGGFLSWMDLHSLRLYQNTAGLHIFVVTAEIIYFLFIIYYMVMQVKAIRAQGWCFLRGHWNLVDTALIVLSWTALAFFVQRTLYAQRDIALFRAQPDRFVSFYQAALSDAALGYLLSLIVLLATTKMWQLLRLNPKLSLLTGALRRAGQDMRSFLTLLSITLGAYAVSCHLMLGATLERYKTIWDSLQTMFSLQLGIFNYEEVFNTSPVLGPLMIGSCIIFMTFTILNLFISVILVAFAEEQENHKPSDDEEIVDMLVWKICSFLGIKRPTGVTN